MSTQKIPSSSDLRILVVAEDPLARAGLATILSRHAGCSVVGQVAPHAELLQSVRVFLPDVVAWDMGSQPVAALELGISIRELSVPVVALLPDSAGAPDVWAAGARGLVQRSANVDNLAAALAGAAQGLTVIDPTFVRMLLPVTREQFTAAPTESLTARERQVLALMAEGQSNKEIARRLGISEHTVKFHVNAILGKLNVQSRTEAVVHATRLGLILL